MYTVRTDRPARYIIASSNEGGADVEENDPIPTLPHSVSQSIYITSLHREV